MDTDIMYDDGGGPVAEDAVTEQMSPNSNNDFPLPVDMEEPYLAASHFAGDQSPPPANDGDLDNDILELPSGDGAADEANPMQLDAFDNEADELEKAALLEYLRRLKTEKQGRVGLLVSINGSSPAAMKACVSEMLVALSQCVTEALKSKPDLNVARVALSILTQIPMELRDLENPACKEIGKTVKKLSAADSKFPDLRDLANDVMAKIKSVVAGASKVDLAAAASKKRKREEETPAPAAKKAKTEIKAETKAKVTTTTTAPSPIAPVAKVKPEVKPVIPGKDVKVPPVKSPVVPSLASPTVKKTPTVAVAEADMFGGSSAAPVPKRPATIKQPPQRKGVQVLPEETSVVRPPARKADAVAARPLSADEIKKQKSTERAIERVLGPTAVTKAEPSSPHDGSMPAVAGKANGDARLNAGVSPMDVVATASTSTNTAPAAAPVVALNKHGKPKKRVSWPADDRLNLIKIFTTEEPEGGHEHAGFGEAMSSEKLREREAMQQQRKAHQEVLRRIENLADVINVRGWRPPPRVETDEQRYPFEGTELSKQMERERGILQTVYPRGAVPDTPLEPSGEDVGYMVDDRTIMRIPLNEGGDPPEEPPAPVAAPGVPVGGYGGMGVPLVPIATMPAPGMPPMMGGGPMAGVHGVDPNLAATIAQMLPPGVDVNILLTLINTLGDTVDLQTILGFVQSPQYAAIQHDPAMLASMIQNLQQQQLLLQQQRLQEQQQQQLLAAAAAMPGFIPTFDALSALLGPAAAAGFGTQMQFPPQHQQGPPRNVPPSLVNYSGPGMVESRDAMMRDVDRDRDRDRGRDNDRGRDPHRGDDKKQFEKPKDRVPCRFFKNKDGCRNGDGCGFLHEGPDGKDVRNSRRERSRSRSPEDRSRGRDRDRDRGRGGDRGWDDRGGRERERDRDQRGDGGRGGGDWGRDGGGRRRDDDNRMPPSYGGGAQAGGQGAPNGPPPSLANFANMAPQSGFNNGNGAGPNFAYAFPNQQSFGSGR